MRLAVPAAALPAAARLGLALAVLLGLALGGAPARADAERAPATAERGCEQDLACLARAYAEAMSADDGVVRIDEVIAFEPGRIRVYSEGRERLAQIAHSWRDTGGRAQIVVEAHVASTRRGAAASQALARARANRVRSYLVRYGVHPRHVVARSADPDDRGRHVDLTITRCAPATPCRTLAGARAAR